MTIIVDTREKPKAIQKILDTFEREGIRVIRSKLYVGDYQRLDNPLVVVDRKQNLLELAQNVGQDHKRFAGELDRAKEDNIKVIILCEHGQNIHSLEDVRGWVNPRIKGSKYYKPSPLALSGERMYKILLQMQKHYGCEFRFCNKSETGKEIIEILNGERN